MSYRTWPTQTMNWSYPSVGAFVFDVPEPGDFSGQFVYNFYVTNERVSTDTHIVEIIEGVPQDYGYARYIQLELNPPTDPSLLTATETIDLPPADKAAIISNYFETMNSEHSIQGNSFATLTLEDAEISGDVTAAIIEAAATQSGLTSLGLMDAMNLMSTTSDTLDVDAMLHGAQIDSENDYAFYDPTAGTAVKYSQTEENGPFAMTFSLNNKFLSDVLKFSESAPLSPLFGKVDSDLASAEAVQAQARAGQDSSLMSIDQYMPTMNVISEETSTEGTTFQSGLCFMGYIIEKYDVVDGVEELSSRAFFTGESGDTLDTVTDYEVKYGATYAYKVSTVYLLRWLEYSNTDSGTVQTTKHSLVKSRSAPKVKIECIETIPPAQPTGIEFFRQQAGTLKIVWTPAGNPTMDVVKYQVFRRSSTDEGFMLLMQLNWDQTESQIEPPEDVPIDFNTDLLYPICTYTDTGFDNDSDYIYAVCAIDAHGLSSNYSAQYRVKYDKTIGDLDISYVSPDGAPKPYPNFLIPGTLTSDSIKDSLHSYLKIYFTPEFYKINDHDGIDSSFIPFTDASGIGGLRMQIINLDRQNSKNIQIMFYDSRSEDESGVVSG